MQDNTQDRASAGGYQEDARVRTHDSTYEIVSKVAYLIGVPRQYFEGGNGGLRQDIYVQMETLKHARDFLLLHRFNAYEVLEQALVASRIQMKPTEKQQFFDKHISNMKLAIDEKGEVSIVLNT